ncbi:hypothetical protein [Kangiella koreensis]|uniref:YopX protein domain-containing protein n=1 Tax=Kangiella koreensis (strain DSM 16069 / JCM 12317 / KCTC 12182 / SW-125) TaxID=523791 RepID=C7R921_KANKD|nr:hypothetical protein [Kangiella koreensis]ACV27811.1 conserved hypothetical protein [Kangiella koreensis DSM 16069]
MEYAHGKVLKIGDFVEWSDGVRGTVVCNISGSIYSDMYKQKDWEYLKTGILVDSEESGLIHYVELKEVKLLRPRSE